MNWADEPRELTVRERSRVRGMGYVRTYKHSSPFARGKDWARFVAWRLDEQMRAQHTCTRDMSSMQCRACNRGIPYPHAEVRDILVFEMPRAA